TIQQFDHLCQLPNGPFYAFFIVKVKMMSLRARLIGLAEHKQAPTALGLVSFVESSVFPIPPDIMLMPMCLARPDRWIFYALITTVTSVLGGLFGYVLGYFFFVELGLPALEALGKSALIDEFRGYYDIYGSMIVFGAGITPFPYKVITITSGFLELNLLAFLIASLLSRGLRFFLVAYLVATYGPSALGWISQHMAKALTIGFAFLLLLFILFQIL
ncbi:MAG: YqaA family protein, partial [Alphaproteobacteria bacterium]